MLGAISQGLVETCPEGQEPIIHLVTSVQAVQAAGLPFVFTDGHAIIDFTRFFTDPVDLDKIDWEVMTARIWRDTPTDPDRKRRRQAEFLIYERCPWPLIRAIGVASALILAEVQAALSAAAHRPVVQIAPA